MNRFVSVLTYIPRKVGSFTMDIAKILKFAKFALENKDAIQHIVAEVKPLLPTIKGIEADVKTLIANAQRDGLI